VVMSFSAISAPADQKTTEPGAPDIGTDERITDALVMLFDAMMTTFRWTDVPDAEPTPLELRLAEIGGTA
jgi:hypothetical protein